MPREKSKFQCWNFRQQLAVAVIAGVLILAVVTSLTVSRTTTETVRDRLYEQGRQLTQAFAKQADFALVSSTEDFAKNAVNLVVGYDNVKAAAIYHFTGESYYSGGNRGLLQSYPFGNLADQVKLALDGEDWHFIAPVFSEDDSMVGFEEDEPTRELSGYVAVVIDKKVLREMRRYILRNNTLVSLGMAVLLLFGLLALAGKITRPLEHLSSIMRRAENSEKQLRSEVYGPKDIVDMQHAFNSMMGVLERRELELLQAKDAALESARIKGEFAANVSHELRTPMNAILGMLDLLMTMGLSPKQSEYVDTAKSAGEALLGLLMMYWTFPRWSPQKLPSTRKKSLSRNCWTRWWACWPVTPSSVKWSWAMYVARMFPAYSCRCGPNTSGTDQFDRQRH